MAVHEVIDSRCTNEIKISLREEAALIVYRLSKTIKDDDAIYTIYFYNITDNMYIVDSKTNAKYYKGDIIEKVSPGEILNFGVYASDKTYCSEYKITNISISVPYYNKYSTNELCEGYENYVLCREDSNVTMTEKDFETSMKKYIESLNEEDEEPIVPQIEKEGFNLFDFIVNNNEIISLSGVVMLIIYIAVDIYISSKKKGGIL